MFKNQFSVLLGGLLFGSVIASLSSPAQATSPATVRPKTDAQVTALAIQAAKDAHIHQGIRSIKGSVFLTSYRIIIEYDPAYFSGVWKGREQAFADGDTYHLADSFVRLLVKDGHNPSMSHDALFVTVCARMPAPPSITGGAMEYRFGCSRYSPLRDTVSWNSHMTDHGD